MSTLCTCGHYEHEHQTINLGTKTAPLVIVNCTGTVFAYPDDAECEADGREVLCQCSGFTPT